MDVLVKTVLKVGKYLSKFSLTFLDSTYLYYTGMYPDVWNNLQVLMNFTYEVNKPPDRTWGTLKDGKWNGMIRQLVEDEIDIAPVEFTITEIRSQAVDFLV